MSTDRRPPPFLRIRFSISLAIVTGLIAGLVLALSESSTSSAVLGLAAGVIYPLSVRLAKARLMRRSGDASRANQSRSAWIPAPIGVAMLVLATVVGSFLVAATAWTLGFALENLAFQFTKSAAILREQYQRSAE